MTRGHDCTKGKYPAFCDELIDFAGACKVINMV